MMTINMQGIVDSVLERAQRQGSVTPEDVQDELTRAGVPEEAWEGVLTLCRRSLRKRQDRYHYVSAARRVSARERQRQAVRRAIRGIIRRHRAAEQVERRGQDRIDFIQPVRVLMEDQRERHVLSRDLSTTGIRLIATRSLLGQKLRIILGEGDEACSLLVRVLWTCAVGDDLYENGCMFLEADEQK
ncbi:MAG TPA: PilZ domain-containing protein [Gemmataceae bacterium]|nr:PilZ domain-containing protein [Gemmataceae bacterium]